jgi:hypothetical protein
MKKPWELIVEFQDIFTTKKHWYGRTDRVYHRIDTGNTCHPPRRLPLAKLAEVDDVMKDMPGLEGRAGQSTRSHRPLPLYIIIIFIIIVRINVIIKIFLFSHQIAGIMSVSYS